MKKTLESLINLDNGTLRDLKYSLSSIYCINKSHKTFQDLLSMHCELENAEYVVYSNINSCKKTDFLDELGACVYSCSHGISEFVLKPSDIEIEEYDCTNHTCDGKLIIQASISPKINLHW